MYSVTQFRALEQNSVPSLQTPNQNKRFSVKNSYRPPKHRQTRKENAAPEDANQDETNLDENQNSDENGSSDNEENSLGEDSDQGFSYWAAGKKIYPGHPDYPRRPKRVDQPNFDCRVQTDDKNGHIFTTEIDKENREFLEEDSNDGNMIFLRDILIMMQGRPVEITGATAHPHK